MQKLKIIPHENFSYRIRIDLRILHLVPCSSTATLQLKSDAKNVFATRESSNKRSFLRGYFFFIARF